MYIMPTKRFAMFTTQVLFTNLIDSFKTTRSKFLSKGQRLRFKQIHTNYTELM